MSTRDYMMKMFRVGLYCGLCVCCALYILVYHSWWLALLAFGASLVFANEADGVLKEVER